MSRNCLSSLDGEAVGVSYYDEKRLVRELPSCMDDATIEEHVDQLRDLKYLAYPDDLKYFTENPESNAYMRKVEPHEAKYSQLSSDEHLIIAIRIRANDQLANASLGLIYEQIAAAEERKHIVVFRFPIYTPLADFELEFNHKRRKLMGNRNYEGALKSMALLRHESPKGYPSAAQMDVLSSTIAELTYTRWWPSLND